MPMHETENQVLARRFADYFDVAELQRLQDAFARTHEVTSVIIDPAGVPITRPSDAARLGGDAIARCPTGGLIMAGGVHLASWLVGRPAEMPAEHFDRICRFLGVIADHISREAVASAELRQTLAAKEHAEVERDRLEAHLRLSASVEAVGRLAGGVAHDFGNILTAIQGYAEQMVADSPDPADPHAPAARILAASDRAADLVRRLLDFARHEPGPCEEIDLPELVEETVALLEHALPAGITVVGRTANEVSPVFGDVSCLQSALLNLGINGGRAMPDGGTLTIEVADRAGDGGADACVEIRVRDTGIGMDAETKRRIFEPFFTTRNGGDGTGLGLARVYSCVHGHGGMIEVESEPGRGSLFTILLPAAGAGTRPRRREIG
ncbi:MAG TPA: ATP-binding protein [Candidatus Krumholzibacteria bacterium]|nr:ATP-binding protein [Candidatus Krumholzibacteria bacterium]HPD73352.1 ATP-binding protein [Candidatus Krumholzibacteria bacterium]HRY42127.1 ATP-binding protein [Candidatus Krumholzibacteria bacterium]